MKTMLWTEIEIEDVIRKDIQNKNLDIDADAVIHLWHQRRVAAAYQMRDILKCMWPFVHGLMPPRRGTNAG